MKIITLALLTVLLSACGTCKANTEQTKLAANTQTKMVQDQDQEPVKIEYSAFTRGSFSKIVLENKKVSIQKNRSGEATVKKCDDEQWSKIMKLVSTLNLKSLSELKAPSIAHQYDGAPSGNFIITQGKNTYSVPTFDAGNPNKAIAPILEMLLAFDKKK